ncbi:HEAT repeat-containing protein 1-like isoform X2 [Amblyomma americanum]
MRLFNFVRFFAQVFAQIIAFAFLPVLTARPPGIVPGIWTPHQEGEICARHPVATDTWEPLATPPLENWTKQAASAAPSSPTAPFASAIKQRHPLSAHCGLCGCATVRTANPLTFVMQVFAQIIAFAFLPVLTARPPGIVPGIWTPHQEGEICARHPVATDTWEPLATPPLENWTKQAASAAPSSPTAPFASAIKQRHPLSAHCGLCGCATVRTANPLTFVMQVSKDLVKKLPEENQAMLLDTLVDLALDTPPSVQHSAVSGALRKVCFFGSLLVEPLQRTGVSQQSPARTVREAKKMRLMDASEEQDPAESPQWKRVLILLEMIQSRKSLEEVMLLVGPLYALLKRSLELGMSPHAEYIRALVRADGPAGAWPVGAPPRTCFPGQVPALHYPEEVLHNVTSVFTYKGTSLLWQVDSCSFQTVMPTVKTVVPALLQACTGESKSAEATESAVALVTRVFVGPFPDIPEHWWLSLFAKLATTLGAGDHLWILAAQMAEHQVTKMGGTDVDEL